MTSRPKLQSQKRENRKEHGNHYIIKGYVWGNIRCIGMMEKLKLLSYIGLYRDDLEQGVLINSLKSPNK